MAEVQETVEPVGTPAPVSDEAELGAVFDRLNAPEEAPKEAEPAPEAPKEAAEAEAESPPEQPAQAEKLPENLPEALKGVLKGLPEDARKAVLADRDGLHRKLSDMGRQVQGIAPIREALVQAVQTIPSLADMKPDQVAQEVLQLAKISHGFKDNPVGTMMGLIKQHGMEKAIGQALSGQNPDAQAQESVALKKQVAALQQQLARVADPNYLRDQVTQITSQERILGDVQSFAAKAEHWGEVEQYIPLFIEPARQLKGDGAAHGAVLETAYKMALNAFKPEALQAPKQPVEDPTLAADPERTKAALKAKSVNVTGKSTGKPRVMTEEEELGAVWERAQRA